MRAGPCCCYYYCYYYYYLPAHPLGFPCAHIHRSVLRHELTLPGADHVLPVDAARIPTGEVRYPPRIGLYALGRTRPHQAILTTAHPAILWRHCHRAPRPHLCTYTCARTSDVCLCTSDTCIRVHCCPHTATLHLFPSPQVRAVAGTPFDFAAARQVGSRIKEVDGPGWHAGYDHCFVLHKLGARAGGRGRRTQTSGGAGGGGDGGGGGGGGGDGGGGGGDVGGVTAGRQADFRAVDPPQLAARLHHPASGRTMEVSTTAPGLQACAH